MRIATILGAFSVGARPLDLANTYTSDRGMTGTELGFLRVTEELRKLGHEVFPFIGHREPFMPWLERPYDAVLSWNEPNLLSEVEGPKRVCYQMLNDFSFVQPGFDEWVDTYVGVCQQHADYVADNSGTSRSKWRVVPLGCDPHLYEDHRVPGRVIYASSPDRGLHWLLQMWPDIRAAVPLAHLRVFYHWSHDHLLGINEHSLNHMGWPYDPHTLEVAQRARYIKKALEVLKPHGVEYVGSVSRERMAREYSEASVFAYPCDPVAFSEGFSCSTLEAHASYTQPVIFGADCLGDIYRESGCWMLERGNRSGFVAAVISALREPAMRSYSGRLAVDECRYFAERHTWAHTAKQLEEILRG